MTSLAATATLTLALLACSPSEGGRTGAATPEPPAATTPVRPRLSVDAALSRAARQRELDVLADVARRDVSRRALGEHFADYLHRTVPFAFERGQALFLQHLHLADPGLDLLQSTIDLARRNLAGFYDPTQKTLYVARDLPARERGLALAHELVHALQDQHFDVGGRLLPVMGAGDRLAAIHALAEGDATAGAEEDWKSWLSYAPAPDREAFEASLLDRHPEAPGVLVASIAAPYVDGTRFVRHLLAAGGWALVNDAWAQPPQTTEQLIHPDKYVAREGWRRLPATTAPREDCELLFWDVLGEQALSTLFRQWSPNGADAAAGWDGDRLDVYQCSGAAQNSLRIAFDTRADAADAQALLSERFSSCDGVQVSTLPESLGWHMVTLSAGDALSCAEARTWMRTIADMDSALAAR